MATTTHGHAETRPADRVSSTDVARASTGWIWGLIFIAAIVLGLFLAFGRELQNEGVENAPAANPNVETPAEPETPANPNPQ